jgi:dTDP-4-amino-4,6-dideoxygalactose transaminase
MGDKHTMAAWPFYGDDEIEAATRVLRSGKANYWTGDECSSFETEFAAYYGVEHAIALANGTLALELALRVLGVGDGDEVIVTPRSFFASASCVVSVGATPVFAEVDRDSQNITAESIEEKVTPRTKAIVPVHLAGWPCDMPPIIELAKRHRIKVIEDCAQAHGARIGGRLAGTFGDVAAFSFCQDKIMSTGGEGGMLLTNNSATWNAAWEYKDHGKGYKRVYNDKHDIGFRWLHNSFGSNLRLTEFQAAIGRIQLGKLDGWLKARRDNVARLLSGLGDLPVLRIPVPDKELQHSYYKFYVFVRPERLKAGWSRDRILAAMAEQGIPGLSGSCPEIYREAAFADRRCPRLKVAQELGETSIMFNVHPTLSAANVDRMVDVTRHVCRQASEQ